MLELCLFDCGLGVFTLPANPPVHPETSERIEISSKSLELRLKRHV
jgi:hypothetical protein